MIQAQYNKHRIRINTKKPVRYTLEQIINLTYIANN